MSKIIINCTDQVLAITNAPVIASGGVGEDFVQFNFCPMWDGFTRKVLAWRADLPTSVYTITLDSTGTGELPAALLAGEGLICIGAYGVNTEGVRRTSEVLRYRIVEGAFKENAVSTPDPDLWEQILAQLSAAVTALNAAKTATAGKADKVDGATAGNLAELDSDGNLVDSGKKPSDFMSATAQLDTANIKDGAVTNAKLDLSTGFVPAGPIVFTSGVQFFESEDLLPAAGHAGRVYLVPMED